MGTGMDSARLHVRAARGLVRRKLPARRLAGLDGRMVFVVGSPRSGTTFLGRSLGSLPGFVDLGELYHYKSHIPELSRQPADQAARWIRRSINTTRTLGLTPGLRGVEHSPETSHVIEQAAVAFPDARFVLMVRDARDVVSSFIDQGWFDGGRFAPDEYGFSIGSSTRFWVEPERADEFPRVSEARRAAWAWRRYVSRVRESGVPHLTLRYEELAKDPRPAAGELSEFLGVAPDPLLECVKTARSDSIGRYRQDLTPEQIDDVMTEAGDLMAELGYR